ncbi:Ubiquitin-conjugating enzyme E2 T, partial [Quaeritorhiza haematococci]
GAWKPSLTIRSVLIAVQLLLSDPNPDDPLLADIANEFRHNYPAFVQKAKEMTRKHAGESMDGINADDEDEVPASKSESQDESQDDRQVQKDPQESSSAEQLASKPQEQDQDKPETASTSPDKPRTPIDALIDARSAPASETPKIQSPRRTQHEDKRRLADVEEKENLKEGDEGVGCTVKNQDAAVIAPPLAAVPPAVKKPEKRKNLSLKTSKGKKQKNVE